MNITQSRQIISKTFEGAFDKGPYCSFMRNLLNTFEEKSDRWTQQYIKDAFKKNVRQYERFGTYHDSDGHLIDLHDDMAAGTKGKEYPKMPNSIREHAREIDKALENILVCDPAIGSGAFPVAA